MNILALIPARGGSKGVPRKNIVKLCGKPLIAYSIEHALASKLINRTIVSTDDEEIAQIARKYGAEVPFIRPKEFAQDLSRDIDVLAHALVWLMDKEYYLPDIVVYLRPCCPVRRAETIDQAIRKFLEYPEADSMRSMSLANQTPYKMWRQVGDYVKPILSIEGIGESYNAPRQILPQVLYQYGYVEINRPEKILNEGTITGDKMLPFLIPEEWVDIDSQEDLIKAGRLIRCSK